MHCRRIIETFWYALRSRRAGRLWIKNQTCKFRGCLSFISHTNFKSEFIQYQLRYSLRYWCWIDFLKTWPLTINSVLLSYLYYNPIVFSFPRSYLKLKVSYLQQCLIWSTNFFNFTADLLLISIVYINHTLIELTGMVSMKWIWTRKRIRWQIEL